MAGKHNSARMMYCNNYKYFRRPIVPFLVPKAQNIDTSVRFNHDILSNIMTNAQKQCYLFSPKPEPNRSVETQTDYRDSESQTIPWEPPYIIKPGHNPEALTIAHLTWNHGLEIGIHDLEVINRLRKKRQLEAALPPMNTPANIKKRIALIHAMEIDEWAFRESEIQAIQDYRYELMEEISKSREHKKEEKLQGRFDRLKKFLFERRDKEIHSVQHNLRRELRKLHRKHQQKQQPFKHDIIMEYADLSSELYAPKMRYGEHPKRRHEIIQKELLGETCIEYASEINTLPNWLPTHEELSAIQPKSKPADLCIRQTRWTKEKLSQLHADLKAIRFDTKEIEVPSLLKCKYKLPPLPPVSHITSTENRTNTNIDQVSTLIQKMIRGRAIQCMMFEGRNRCRELIGELQSAYGLEERSKTQHQKEKKRILALQHQKSENAMQEDRLCEILNSLEGITVSGMLDYLSKELTRLEDERRIHAFALLAERERAMKEAAEAGRRQLEYNRRREFDEMFRQIIKVNQESVECYLEDIIKESIEWVSDEATKAYISKLCDKVDSVSKEAQQNASKLADEELVANMIYNFVLPEVEKNTVRKNIREKQQAYLHNAHAAIYKEILNLPSVQDTLDDALDEKRKESDSSSQLDMEKISKTCSTICVTEAELKSVHISSLENVESFIENIISNIILMI